MKVFIYFIGLLLIMVLGLSIVLWMKSPGIAEPIADENGNILSKSISTIEKVNLGNLDQYVIIRGLTLQNRLCFFFMVARFAGIRIHEKYQS